MAQPQAQPNYQRLADACTAASEECSRLPNIPAINTSVDLIGQLRDEMGQLGGEMGQLRDEIGQLRDEMRQSATRTTERFHSLQTEMTTMRAAVATVQADITIIRADISAIHIRLDGSEGNAIACLFNSTISISQTLFQPLQTRHNISVQSFPENGETLSNLSHIELTTILREYNLFNDGSVVDKRKWLAQYIGVVVQVF